MSEKQTALPAIHDLQQEISLLRRANDFLTTISQSLDFESFLRNLVAALSVAAGCERVIAFVPEAETGELHYTTSHPDTLDTAEAKVLHVSVFNTEDTVLAACYQRYVCWIHPADSATSPAATALAAALGEKERVALPLRHDNQLRAVIVADSFPQEAGNQEAITKILQQLMEKAEVSFRNVQLHSDIVDELALKVQEQYVLHQIDIELNDTIDLSHIFDMTLDWALRFTNAQAASLALYDQESDSLRFMVEYGYEIERERLEMLRKEYDGGITHRVARSGHVEIVPDVSMDKDFIRVHNSTQSQMSLPVMREDRVIAVMTLESKRLNGFAEHHQDFVEKLASRAGVAIDNARLYEETELERQKLSYILSSTADVVIVVAPDDRIMLINQAALSTLRLYAQESYVGRSAYEVFDATPLVAIYRRAVALGENLIEEMVLPSERTLHVKLTPHEGIGWIIVMHDGVGELIIQAASLPKRVVRVLARGFSFSQFTTRVRFIAAAVSTNCRWVLSSPL